MDFKITVCLEEFHLIHGALAEKRNANEKKMEEMFVKESPDAIFAMKISNQKEYDKLQRENEEITILLEKIFKETGEQL